MPYTKKFKTREAYLLRTYGIDNEQYNLLLQRQKGGCALCSKTPEQEGKSLAVDHDHVSGEIRGLLCLYCNKYRVGRHRDPKLLRKMARYLEKGTGWFVPKKKRKKRGR